MDDYELEAVGRMMADLVYELRQQNVQMTKLIHQIGIVAHDNWRLWEGWMTTQWPDLVTAVKKLERL